MGSTTRAVEGKVVLPGEIPLANATVTFKSVGKASPIRGRGQTDENGNFELMLNEKRKGLPPGTYQVTVTESLGDDLDSMPAPQNSSQVCKLRRIWVAVHGRSTEQQIQH